jgi:hypothetical protein
LVPMIARRKPALQQGCERHLPSFGARLVHV